MNKKNVKKILLTGGDGFIGKNILEYLDKKYVFLSPSISELNLTDTKSVYNFLKENKVDIVLHAANVGGIKGKEDPSDAISTNLRMFFNLINAKPFYKRMVMFGSGAEYDKTRPIIKAKESDFGMNIPIDQYGFYKYICSKYAEGNDFITHIRLFGVYGKYERYETRFISNTICKVLLSLPININQNVFFDYIYIKDLVKAVDCLIKKQPKYKFYNIGRGKSVDLFTIAKKILKISKRDLPILVKNTGLNNEYTCDISRFSSEFPSFKFTDFSKSLEELFAYYKKLTSKIDKGSLL